MLKTLSGLPKQSPRAAGEIACSSRTEKVLTTASSARHARGGHIHHDTVTIFDRKAEDAPSYALVVERGGCVSNITGARAEQDNPSSRRHGVAIRFWCEECDTISELTVEQHKGSTRLRWRAAEGHYSPNTKCDEPPLLSIIRRFGQ